MLQAREDAVQAIVKEAHNKLGSLTSDKKAYRSLLTDLTVQARRRLARCIMCRGAILQRSIDGPTADDTKTDCSLLRHSLLQPRSFVAMTCPQMSCCHMVCCVGRAGGTSFFGHEAPISGHNHAVDAAQLCRPLSHELARSADAGQS